MANEGMNDPIKTRYRRPIPKGLSYPVGSEAISSALKGVPQFAELSITFWCLNPAAFAQSISGQRHVPASLRGDGASTCGSTVDTHVWPLVALQTERWTCRTLQDHRRGRTRNWSRRRSLAEAQGGLPRQIAHRCRRRPTSERPARPVERADAPDVRNATSNFMALLTVSAYRVVAGCPGRVATFPRKSHVLQGSRRALRALPACR